ncbi:FliG C-terminal domain-containing protein [Phaeobacter gallaeciensis]|uniref:flagellar motor switch protein FliG n=1 Tax=Phaeobacter gallaeciensis TaxID=60890 RepID=UPI00237F35A1|nr:FliG C-terminal domain-containing protein [Phaeobacter gallaeciensis]MDE4304335.1 FliG C-terminal domain-containing protein [Phaeobacter gallaeciensis]MDE4308322.1 FliG C-terminal domain-containing protein [Phaeobacter gallaeciensis]MDE4312779.1 FliG C-terminal domain-containing protein [Phaeobacter gallaeciensis]MDE4317266.1 FliG C-terminal domain-containing protein [Phaeobacter gallaeciensis]MDE4321729.1 FliG C-terminal domain-containing protein [Phaeobacter gallaeciensis]
MQDDQMLALPMATGGDGLGDFSAPAPLGGMGGGMDSPMGGSLGGSASHLSGKAKAAIVVRLLLNEGADIPIEELPDELQMELTQQMGKMRIVDRETLYAVASEFAEMLDNVGLTFPNGLAGALTAMDGKISRHTASRLRKEAGVRQFGNPWDRLKQLAPEDLASLAEAESTEVAAVLLSKLDTAKAAQMLAALPGPVARKIAYAVSHTKNVTPDTVDRIGLSLAAQVEARPDLAFDTTPGQRVGAILTEAAAAKRDEVLTALEEEDEEFAVDVRKAIFTYGLIAERMHPLDVPKLMRVLSQPDVVTAIAFASAEEDVASSEFLLENMSNRMANNIREEVTERGKVKRADGETAFSMIVNAMRDLVNNGEIELRSEDGEEDE